MKSKILFLALLLGACASTPKLPAPTIIYPTPPAALMEPSQNLHTIGEKPLDR